MKRLRQAFARGIAFKVSVRLVPVRGRARVNLQRNADVEGGERSLLHHAPDKRKGCLDLFVCHFENELVVNLQKHPCAKPGFLESWLHADHGPAHDVRGRPLNGRVDGLTLNEGALGWVF